MSAPIHATLADPPDPSATQAKGGETILGFAARMCARAEEAGTPILGIFNDTTVTIRPGDVPGSIVKAYYQARRKPARSPIVEAVATNLHAAVDRLVDELNGADVAYRTEIVEAWNEGHEAGKREAADDYIRAINAAVEDARAAATTHGREEERAEILALVQAAYRDHIGTRVGRAIAALEEQISARAT